MKAVLLCAWLLAPSASAQFDFQRPNLTVPDLGGTTPRQVPTPRVVEAARPDAVVPAVRGAPVAQYIDGCADLRLNAQKLRRAADECDWAVRHGELSSCVVQLVSFRIPTSAESVSPAAARSLAKMLDAVSESGDQYACRRLGGRGEPPPPRYETVLERSSRYYGALCRNGDEYGCQAKQLSELCFDQSPVNECVRGCLVDRDCPELLDEEARLDCRKRSHWRCYEVDCNKWSPTPLEMSCISRMPGWWKFLLKPNLGR